MSKNFITNQDQLLSEVVNHLIPGTENLYFLVGFFYFSGFEEIFQTIQDKQLKILVGLDIEKGLMNKVKEVEFLSDETHSRAAIRERFNKGFIDLFNGTDLFDSSKNIRAFKLFYEKIKDGTLEIRKTLEPNHSKLYLFEYTEPFSRGGEQPGSLITGSSNLTRSGFRGQYELNVILHDRPDFEEGKRIFNELWNSAVIIADKEHLGSFEEEVIEKIWFEKLYKPFLVYVRVLHEYFSIEETKTIKLPHEITKERFINLRYQTDAIKQAISTIEKHSGVIIADVVGLGKSVIASSVAHNLGLKTMIIAPPHLVKQWDDEYRDYFDFNAKVFSSGSIEKAVQYLDENSDGEQRLIIVDEAHKYRNEDTGDYAFLHRLCQGNKVILLTATPFNNRPQDIFSMIKLFQIPAKSTLKTVGNLSEEFARLIGEYKKIIKTQKEKSEPEGVIRNQLDEVARQIRLIISPLVIRRSRLDLEEISAYKKDLAKQKIRFSKVHDPEELEYPLGKMEGRYISTLEKIAPGDDKKGFKGTRYRPVSYLKNIEKYKKKIEEVFGNFNLFRNSQEQISMFMRRLLVRRFESSIASFESTLKYMIQSSENILNWMETRQTVPVFKKGRLPEIADYFELDSDDILPEIEGMNFEKELEKLTKRGLFEIPVLDIKNGFKADLEEDILLLKDIDRQWFEHGIDKDPKLEAFKKILTGKLKTDPRRKIIVFSEFSDTIDYLYNNLKNNLPVFKYTSKDASTGNKEIIRANFDAGIAPEKQSDNYQILLATDAISEGYNLHRAGTIINYDIPYNPTRVIQRIGRINRINKKVFDELFIYNYFPSVIGEFETRTKEISTLKVAMIQALLGDDTKVLTSDEELRSYYKETYRKELASTEQRSWDTPFRNFYMELAAGQPEILDESLKIPQRARIARKGENPYGVLVFGKKGNDYIFRISTDEGKTRPLSPEEAFGLFEAEITEKPFSVSDQFEKHYSRVKKDLFARKTEITMDKLKREVTDKLEVFMALPGNNLHDYLPDLISVIRLDSLPRHYLKYLNKLKEKELVSLPRVITPHYISTILTTAQNVDAGEELLILAEEFQNK